MLGTGTTATGSVSGAWTGMLDLTLSTRTTNMIETPATLDETDPFTDADPGPITEGPMTATFRYDSTTAAIYSAALARQKLGASGVETWTFVDPSGATHSCQAYISAVTGPTMAKTTHAQFQVTWTPSGEITHA
jgi:hypothetical protein